MGYIQCCSIAYARLFIADFAGENSWNRCSAPSSSASFAASQFVFPSYSHMWCDNYGDKWFILMSNLMVSVCNSSQKRCFLCICLLVISFCDEIMFVSSVLSSWMKKKCYYLNIFTYIAIGVAIFLAVILFLQYCHFVFFFPPEKYLNMMWFLLGFVPNTHVPLRPRNMI